MIRTLYMNPKFLLLPVALALVGAGCFSAEPAQPAVPQEPVKKPAVVTPPAPTPSQPTPTPAPTPTSTAPVPSSVLPVIDATWKTYANAALKFSFQYPTKGSYAPTWGVNILKTTDAKLEAGCYKGDGNPRQNKGELQVGDTTFCITRYEDTSSGQRLETDYYVGGLGGNVILLTFSKKLSETADVGIYNAHLDQIVGTYTHE